MKQQKGGPCPSQFSGLSCSSRSSSSEDDLAPQKSPAPSREELTQDEADFVPDYDETLGLTDTKDRALERIVKTTVNGIQTHLLHSLVERPSAVATSVMSMTHQLVSTNHLLTDVGTKLKNLCQPKTPQPNLVQLNHLMGDICAELQQLDRNRVEANRNGAAFTSAVRDLTAVLRAHNTTVQMSMDALNTGVQAALSPKPVPLTTPAGAATPGFEFDVMKMAGEYDVNWSVLQQNKVDTHAQRRPEYPHFDAPTDRANREPPKPVAIQPLAGVSSLLAPASRHHGHQEEARDKTRHERSPRKTQFTTPKPRRTTGCHRHYCDAVRRSVDRIIRRK